MKKLFVGVMISLIIIPKLYAQKDLTQEVQEAIYKSQKTRENIQNTHSPRDPASLKKWKNSKEMLTEFDELLNSNEDRDWFNEVDKLTKE